jgi:4-methyl-5(b-hydroxyethyl)-thiazole monophosphate biosynthesis
MPHVVLIPIAQGFEEIEAITLIDVLRRGAIEVIVASLNETLLVEGAHGVVIGCDRCIEGLTTDELDMILLPGGWGGTMALIDHPTVQSLLTKMDAEGKNIGAICAAPLALYRAGVLKEGYTCYPGIQNDISIEGFRGESQSVVESGNIMTSRGPSTAMEFALAIVKKLAGEAMYTSLCSDLLVV